MDLKQWYTVERTLSNMTLLEDHMTDYLTEMKGKGKPEEYERYQQFKERLREVRKELDQKYGRTPQTSGSDRGVFCLECVSKHLWLLQGYADEGIGFFPGDELWGQLRELVSQARQGVRPADMSCATCGARKGHVAEQKAPIQESKGHVRAA